MLTARRGGPSVLKRVPGATRAVTPLTSCVSVYRRRQFRARGRHSRLPLATSRPCRQFGRRAPDSNRIRWQAGRAGCQPVTAPRGLALPEPPSILAAFDDGARWHVWPCPKRPSRLRGEQLLEARGIVERADQGEAEVLAED